MRKYLWVMICLPFLLFNCSSQSLKEEAPGQPVLTPYISGEYVHAYNPQGDLFPGPDTKRLKAGEYYQNWQPNDHCFVKGPDSCWHAFGITHPAVEPGERVSHDGEYLSFHAVSPGVLFEYSFREHSLAEKPKVLPPTQRPGESVNNHAPTILEQDSIYKMIYGPIPFRMAVSKDLYTWEPKGPLKIEESNGRDPSLMLWDNLYYLSYCSGNVVKVTTSKDLENWTDPVEIYKGELASYQCESPTIIRHNDKFYLFWCLWDTSIASNGYGERTFVYCSDNPLDFHGKPFVTELAAHAPEIVQGEDGGRWYISSAQYPKRGINIARLGWK